jgi:hypothetical protein
VTVAALIARIQTIEMPFHFALALHNGVKPSELSEIITHLASGCTATYTGVAFSQLKSLRRSIPARRVDGVLNNLTIEKLRISCGLRGRGSRSTMTLVRHGCTMANSSRLNGNFRKSALACSRSLSHARVRRTGGRARPELGGYFPSKAPPAISPGYARIIIAKTLISARRFIMGALTPSSPTWVRV